MTFSVRDQVAQVLQGKNWIAGLIGSAFAVVAPIGGFALSHYAVNFDDWRGWSCFVLLLGCLAFSAPKVFRWAKVVFGSALEAAGFMVALEGLMTLAPHSHWMLIAISYYALFLLVSINAIVGATRVVIDHKEVKAQAKVAASDTLSISNQVETTKVEPVPVRKTAPVRALPVGRKPKTAPPKPRLVPAAKKTIPRKRGARS